MDTLCVPHDSAADNGLHAGASFTRRFGESDDKAYAAPQATRMPMSEIFKLAEKTHNKLGELTGPYDFNIDAVVRYLGGRVKRMAMDTMHAPEYSLKVRCARDFTIYIARGVDPAYERVLISHDLGHYFLHHQARQSQGLAAVRYGGGLVEREADWFAQAFLMPKKKFIAARKECDSEREDVAKMFRVTVDSCVERARDLNVELNHTPRLLRLYNAKKKVAA